MMPAIAWILAGLGAAGVGLGFFADRSGQAVDESSNAALKFAAAGVVAYIVMKKAKVI